MGHLYDAIAPRLRAFIEAMPVFFVATAPLSPDGHVDVSPKGIGGTFAVVDERTVAYLASPRAARRRSPICGRTGASR